MNLRPLRSAVLLGLFVTIALYHCAPVCAQSFTVSGATIKAPDGSTFVPRGANIGLWRDCADAATAAKIKNDWQMNTVRVYLRLAGGTAVQTPTDALLDRYVNAYTAPDPTTGRRAVVMFECHDHSGRYYTDTSTPSKADLLAFWRRVAQRYKNNPWVWFNVMNEPGGQGPVSQEWYDLHNAVVQAIRAEGANNVIVCDGNGFASEDGNGTTKAAPVKDATSAILTYGQQLQGADPQRRLVFTLHTYNDWRYSPDKLFDYVQRVRAKGLPLIVGEFAATTGSSAGDYPVTESARAVMLASARYGVGALAWHFLDGDRNALCTAAWGATSGDAINATGNARPSNLTWLGERLWDLCHNNPDPSAPATWVPIERFPWSATASGGTAASRGIDSDPDTAWTVSPPSPASETGDAWLASAYYKVDLGSPQWFSQILIDTRKEASGWMRDFTVYASNDPAQLGTAIKTVTGNRMATVVVNVTDRQNRFITIKPTKVAKSGYTYQNWSIADVRVYRYGTYAPPAEGTVELGRAGWVASANKRSGWNAEWEPKALDGSFDSRWASGAAVVDGDWFQVDMGASRTVKSFVMNAGSSAGDYPRRFDVYVSDSTSNWGSPVYSALGEPNTKIVFPSARAGRYVRIVNRQAAGAWWSVHEFKAYAP